MYFPYFLLFKSEGGRGRRGRRREEGGCVARMSNKAVSTLYTLYIYEKVTGYLQYEPIM